MTPEIVDLTTNSRWPMLANFYRHAKRRKWTLAAYLFAAFLAALLVSHIFGENYAGLYDPFREPHRRSPRQTSGSAAPNSDGPSSQEASFKEPFPNRPRIQTKNGHLVIEASKDKNIDFRTSGVRGSVTINGYKLDQLLNVTRALERSSAVLMSGAKAPPNWPPGKYQSLGGTADSYDVVLRSLFGSEQRSASLERIVGELKFQVGELKKKVRLQTKRDQKKTEAISKLKKEQETLVAKLRRNECFDSETGQPTCKNGATCLDSYDGFKCLCPPNWEGATCELDVDECAKFRGTDLGCQNGAKCVNRLGGYLCECPAQFHGVHCTERHEDCSMSSSRSLCANGKCINLARTVPNQPSFECVCDQGWTTDGTNPACVIDINECLAGDPMNNQALFGKGVSSMSNSSSSSQMSALQAAAVGGAYPCSQAPFVDCINLPGSFQCAPCPPGYTGNGRVCRDLDECQTNNGGCSQAPPVECINTPGSRRCAPCPPGYTGDGLTCTRISACALEANGGCDTMARCVDLPGVSVSSRICICQYPYTGDGIGPGGCRPLPASAIGPKGSRNEGVSTGESPQTSDTDDCVPNPCLNGAQCQRTEYTFECICPLGWFGRLCEQQSLACGGQAYASRGNLQFPLGGSYNEMVRAAADSGGELASGKRGERHYRCLWSISVSPENMSLELSFTELTNKVNPSKRVQIYLTANTSSSGAGQQVSNCDEWLEVRERLVELSNVVAQTSGTDDRRLLARFCTGSRGGATSAISTVPAANVNSAQVSASRPLVIRAESNTVELEYSFSATRTQFGEPSLAFEANWTKLEPACGGLQPMGDSGNLSSPNFPEFYQAGIECRYLLRAAANKRIRIQFGELNLLAGRQHHSLSGQRQLCADSLTILDGSLGSPDRPVLFRHCANNDTLMSLSGHHSAGIKSLATPIVSSSSSVEVILTSSPDSMTPLMRPKKRRGFYLTWSSEPAAPGCGGLYTLKSAVITSADYEPMAGEPDPRSALQLARYFEARSRGQSMEQRPKSESFEWSREAAALQAQTSANPRSRSNASAAGYSTRCEYEIRPAKQARNQKIALDWLDMPGELTTGEARGSIERWWRALRCSKRRLTLYDGNPLDGSNRTELATFCAGDRYNASSNSLPALITSGHILVAVYESSELLAEFNPTADLIQDNDSSAAAEPLAPVNGRPGGFKLRYSLVCTATYHQASARIVVDLSPEVSECIYHIVLPPNNTISLAIETGKSASEQQIMNLPDGSCAAQAIFLDGALPRSARSALIGVERQLKAYNFETRTQPGERLPIAPDSAGYSQATRAGSDLGSDSVPASIGPAGSLQQVAPSAGGSESGDTGGPTYWQYSSSQAHDIKEFEVCGLPALGFDSVWNHLSLMFRLKQQQVDGQQQQVAQRVRMAVRYQAEAACGGIIDASTSPPEGSLVLDSMRRIQGLTSYPITVTKYEQLHKQQFTSSCAWVLRAAHTSRHIQILFEAPQTEILSRFSDWLAWFKSRQRQLGGNRSASGSGNGTTGQEQQQSPSAASFNCGQVFQESIELYEPWLNRTRHLCPIDLFSDGKPRRWVTQSSVVYIRLHNSSDSNSAPTSPPFNNASLRNNSEEVWPGSRRPLAAGSLMVKYRFGFGTLGSRTSCGGQLIQDSGTIRSPNYPYNYPPNMHCVWLIQTKPQQQIRLNITRFELEKQADCVFDHLELRNGPMNDSPLIGRFCNNDLQSKVIVSHSNFLWLKFSSDANLGRQGFEIHYDGAQTGCGGHLSTASGHIDSPNFPLPFGHGADCEWSIEVSQANRIELTVWEVDLSSEGASCSTVSGSDYLEIIDPGPGGERQGGKQFLGQPHKSLGKFCHLKQMNSTKFISSGNKFFIVFKSQPLDYSRGFRLTYTTLCVANELVGQSGVIESPGFPDGYLPHSWCGWLIRAPLGSNLTLALVDLEIEDPPAWDLDTQISALLASSSSNQTSSNTTRASWECNKDFLELWSLYLPSNWSLSGGPTPTAALLASEFGGSLKLQPRLKEWKQKRLVQRLCGTLGALNDKQRVIQLDTHLAYLRFESDRSVEMRGFRIEWQAQANCGGRQISDEIQAITYHEPQVMATGGPRPIECLWTFDLAPPNRVGSKKIDFSLNSNFQVPGGSLANTNNSCDDSSVTIYDGLTDQAPILTRNCDSVRAREAVLTTGSQALVRFYSSGKHNFGRGFMLGGWSAQRDNCLGSTFELDLPFNVEAGSKRSPLYPDLYESQPYRCHGLMSSRTGRLRFRIRELDIPVAPDETSSGLLGAELCKSSGNFLMFRSTSGAVEEVFCGHLDKSKAGDLARSTVIFEQEAVWQEFYTSKRTFGNLRGRWMFTYDRLCGSAVQVDYPRDFVTPNYPNRPNWPTKRAAADSEDAFAQLPAGMSENVCIWRLKTTMSEAKSQERRIHLNIINFIESGDPNRGGSSNDCLRVYEGADLSLRQGSFNLTDIDARLQPKIKLCRQKDLRYSTLVYMSQGSELIVMVTGQAVAKFRAKPFENYCGGEFHLGKAEFASPGYPEAYRSDLDCNYFVVGSPGSRINLNFLKFDLPEPVTIDDGSSDDGGKSSTSCDNVDYMEIRQLSAQMKIKSKLNTVLSSGSAASRWSDAGFLIASSEQASSGNSSDNSTLSSKESTNATIGKTSQQLAGEPSKQRSGARLYELAKLYYILSDTGLGAGSHSRLGPHFARATLSLDDFFENSKLLGRFCGKRAPNFSGSTALQDEILIRFRSHGAGGNNRGFLLEYKLAYGGFIQVPSLDPVINDSAGMDEEQTSLSAGFISSPNYPGKVRYNDTITWTFETKLDSVLQFDLVSLNLGPANQDCQDSLSIYDGLNPKTSMRLSQVCGHLSFKNLQYKRLGTFYGAWRQPQLQAININQLPINLAYNPAVKAALIRTVRTESNVASLVYSNFQAEGSFLLRYRAIKRSILAALNETSQRDNIDSMAISDTVDPISLNPPSIGNASKACSRTIQLTPGSKNVSQAILTSPNWPQPANSIECHWLVYTLENTNIRLSVDPDNFAAGNLTNTVGSDEIDNNINNRFGYKRTTDYCLKGNERRNFIAVHDGATHLAPLIAIHCLPVAPIQFTSSGRHMFIRYVISDLYEPSSAQPNNQQQRERAPISTASEVARRSKFKSRVSVGECGGQYHIVSTARVRDRPLSAGKTYANDVNCKYYLFAADLDKSIVIHNEMSDFDLASEPTNENCTVGDYIEIRDLPINSDQMDYERSGGRLLGRYCAGKKLDYFEAPGSAISIEFHTDGANTAAGWDLYVTSYSQRIGCPSSMVYLSPDEPFGQMMSPNWPHGINGRHFCKYQIMAPNNQTIQVTFVRLNRPLAEANSSEGESTKSGATRSSTSGAKCADKLSYMADNEAFLFRYVQRPFINLRSPVGGYSLDQLVKQVPCQLPSLSARESSNSLVSESGDQATNSAQLNDEKSLTLIYNTTGPSVKKITTDEYYALALAAPPRWRAFTIHSSSHMVVLEYEAKKLQYKEGFFAIFRLMDQTGQGHKMCGGDVSYRPPPDGSAEPQTDEAARTAQDASSALKRPTNLIESARFGLESSDRDEYIQCDWNLRGEGNFLEQLGQPLVEISYSAIPTLNVGSFKSAYLVFQVLEIPPQVSGGSIYYDWESMGPDETKAKNEVCGLNRLLIAGPHTPHTLICGNLTGTRQWAVLEYYGLRLSLRTKNLRSRPSVPSADGDNFDGSPDSMSSVVERSNKLAIYRGIRAYLYEKACLQVERLIGEGVRLRSHPNFPNSSYEPGICKWYLRLGGGDYELWFEQIKFRPPANYSSAANLTTCDTSDPDLDYLEVRASEEEEAPLLARFCIYNQLNNKQKALMLNMTSTVSIVFVAGISQLSKGYEKFPPKILSSQTTIPSSGVKNITQVPFYGWDMQLVRIKNESMSDFCRRNERRNIYWFIANKDYSYYDSSIYSYANSMASFLYPKNAHCIVDIKVNPEGARFNLSFKGIFDFEASQDCQKDYIQIDDLFDQPVEILHPPAVSFTTRAPKSNARAYSGPPKRASTTVTATTSRPPAQVISLNKVEPMTKLIGKWCGRVRPAGFFVSRSNRIRITFHSNDRIEGRGFHLEYSVLQPPNSTQVGKSDKGIPWLT